MNPEDRISGVDCSKIYLSIIVRYYGTPRLNIKYITIQKVQMHDNARKCSSRTNGQMGLVARKLVFGISDKARFKPVSFATETS